MQQRPLQTQTPEVEPVQTAKKTYQWIHYFFTDASTASNHRLADWQRRAVWIGLATILLSLDVIDHNRYFPYVQPFGSLIPFALVIGSFFAMWMAFRSSRSHQGGTEPPRQLNFWQRAILVIILLLTIPGAILLGLGIALSVSEPQFSNDGTSLDTNAAILLVQGRNPYTDSSLPELARHFRIQPDWTTPLRRGQLAGRLDYPSRAELQSVLDTSLKTQHTPEFEQKVSYPALSFLSLVPFVLFGDYNVLPLYVAGYLLIIAVAWKAAHPAIRPWVLILAIANIPMWASADGGNLDILYILFVLLAWLLRERRWSSALCFGLALASKQIAWFFAPFYFILLWRNYSLKEAIKGSFIAGMIGLAINLPFILWNPQAWLAGVLAPQADPMFPMGDGIIGLSVTHLLPYLPLQVYQVLQGIAMLLTLVWYWRISRRHPEAAMLLAVMPLFFAWRSLSSYFFCTALPLFSLFTARVAPELQTSDAPVKAQKLIQQIPQMATSTSG